MAKPEDAETPDQKLEREINDAFDDLVARGKAFLLLFRPKMIETAAKKTGVSKADVTKVIDHLAAQVREFFV